MRWLNYFYTAANLDTSFRHKIIDDEFKVIPNQNGIFQTRSYLKIGKEIDETLKDVLKILDIDLRDSLKKSDAFTGNEIKYTVYSQQQAIDQINTSVQNSKT